MKFNTLGNKYPFTVDVWNVIALENGVATYGFKESITARVYLDGSGIVKVHTPEVIDLGWQLKNIRDSYGELVFPTTSDVNGATYKVSAAESVMNPFGFVEARRYTVTRSS